MTAINTKQILKEIERLNSIPKESLNEEEARELLQSFFDASLLKDGAENTESAFSLLYKINTSGNIPIMQINFSRLLFVLTFCLDLIFAESEKRIIFVSDFEEEVKLCAAPEAISLCISNIIFNILKMNQSPYYFISLGTNAKSATIKIEFEPPLCKCAYIFKALSVDYLYSLGGRLLFSQGTQEAAAIISFPKITNNALPEYRIPEVEDLLFDRLSLIYSALF